MAVKTDGMAEALVGQLEALQSVQRGSVTYYDILDKVLLSLLPTQEGRKN